MPAAAMAAALRAGATRYHQHCSSRTGYPYGPNGFTDDDLVDVTVAAAAGAAIAARRAAAAQALAEQQQSWQQQQQEEEEEEQDTLPPMQHIKQEVIMRKRKSIDLNDLQYAAANASRPAAAGDKEQQQQQQQQGTDIPAGSTWLHELLQCDYLFEPCGYCSGRRMERPSAGRDKLIRFFNPADPSRGYCNYCPELHQHCLMSVGRIHQNGADQYYIKLPDVMKAAAAAAVADSSSSTAVQLADIEEIQTYPIGGDRVLFLAPRQQQQQHRQRQRQFKQGGTCLMDGRHLKDPDNCFCSITCKLAYSGGGSSMVDSIAQQHLTGAAAAAGLAAAAAGEGSDVDPAAAAAAAAANGGDQQDGRKRMRLTEAEAEAEATQLGLLPTNTQQQQQLQEEDEEILPAQGTTQQQQQQQQLANVPASPLPGTAMHIVMPSGNQVQVVTDARGNTLVLHVPSPTAAAAAAVATADELAPVAVLQPAPEFLQHGS